MNFRRFYLKYEKEKYTIVKGDQTDRETSYSTDGPRLFSCMGMCVCVCVCVYVFKSLSRGRLFVISWTVNKQAPLSMGFSRPEYWSGLPFPSPGHLSDPGIKPRSPILQADSLLSELPGKTHSYV